ncbi:MAG: hypothetical protein ASARMPREDX12_008063 [Alectoria sarmentosa]|nr:MAG: hypothetical protein ASARMPREDX12_008063 [Alectoria sarmentosa]
MEPHGPRRRGGPPGMYDDTSDSMDNIGGHWDDHPVRGFGEDGSRRSTRGGPHGRRGAGSRDMTDLMDEMDLHERQRRAGGRDLSHIDAMLDEEDRHERQRRAGGRDRSHIDAMLDEVELHEREHRAGGRDRSHIDAMLDDMESDPHQGRAGGRVHGHEGSHLTMQDLPRLKETRAYMMEGIKNARSGEERRTLQLKFNMMAKDIARLEYERRESGTMPRGMGGPVVGTGSNSRQSRAGGRRPREMGGEMQDDRRKPRGMGAPMGRRDREDYADEESDDYPLEPRRGYSQSAAGQGNPSSRRLDL